MYGTPFTQMATWHEDAPLIIEKARGNWLVDTDGNRYLDGVSSLWDQRARPQTPAY